MGPRFKSRFVNYDLISYFYSLVRQIPEGRIATYGDLARALGDVRAARACGYMLSILTDHDGVPSHRVVKSDGTVGKYSHESGIKGKIERLEGEGINVKGEEITNFRERLFNDFETDYPLRRMQEEQIEISRLVSLSDDYCTSKIGAVDVSYDNGRGYACMAIFEDGEYSFSEYTAEIKFPYIPGYLSYREHFFIEKLAKEFDGLLLIDGNGILHPRKMGLASFSGVLLDIPTIGIAKSLLVGSVDDGWISYKGERLGFMLGRKTIISPGHRISLNSSIDEVRKITKDKYPEILKIVDRKTVLLRNGMN